MEGVLSKGGGRIPVKMQCIPSRGSGRMRVKMQGIAPGVAECVETWGDRDVSIYMYIYIYIYIYMSAGIEQP